LADHRCGTYEKRHESGMRAQRVWVWLVRKESLAHLLSWRREGERRCC
jgi:hypothetical protein